MIAKKSCTLIFVLHFFDVSQVGAPNTKLLVQIKDERWFGEFIDIKEEKNIPDHSVLNVIVLSQAEQVVFFIVLDI